MPDLTTLLSKFLNDLYAGVLGTTVSFTSVKLGGDTTLSRTADGKISEVGTANTSPMFQLGGTSNSFPALKRNGAVLEVRLADDSSYASFNASTTSIATLQNLNTGALLWSTTAPTISSGFGASPSIANNNGTAAFVVNVGTGGAATSGVIGVPTAANGWVAHCIDITAAAGHTGLRTVQTASAANTITIESQNSAGAATAWASGSLVRVIATAF